MSKQKVKSLYVELSIAYFMDYTPLQFVFMYGTAIFFSAISMERETLLSSFVAAFSWLLTALFSFILGPSGVGIAFGWCMGILSFVFMGVFLWRLVSQVLGSRDSRRNPKFETWGPF
jgi:hypothetical protein